MTFQSHSTHVPNLTDELGTAEERRLNQFGLVSRLGLERQTTLSSAGSALCDVGAAAYSYGVLVMCRT